MRGQPPLDPDVEDEAPGEPHITAYDEEHYVTYLRLLDASRDGADWREVARIAMPSLRKRVRAVAGKAISLARNGCRRAAIVRF